MLEQLRLPQPEGCQGVSLVDHISGALPDNPLIRFAEADHYNDYALFKDHLKLIVTIPPGPGASRGLGQDGDAACQAL